MSHVAGRGSPVIQPFAEERQYLGFAGPTATEELGQEAASPPRHALAIE